MVIRSIVIATLFFQVFLKQSLAGAWLQPKDYSQIIYQFIIDDVTSSKSYHNLNLINKTHYSIYFEHGLHRDLTVGFNTTLTPPHDSLSDGIAYRAPNFTELFARLPLFNKQSIFASVQFLAKFPINYSYLRDDSLYPQGQMDYEVRLQLGFSLDKYNWLLGNFTSVLNGSKWESTFLDIGLALRHRKDLSFDEVRGEFTYGFVLWSKYMLMLSSYHILQVSKLYPVMTRDEGWNTYGYFNKHVVSISRGIGENKTSSLSIGVFISNRYYYELGVMLGWWLSFGKGK